MRHQKKTHVPIPAATAANVLFLSDRTCCVCRERGKAVQIHHIDDDPANSVAPNLSVLCLECHTRTQLTGGFGRHLDASQVTNYRDDWLVRVKNRRDDADQLAVKVLAGVPALAPGGEAPALHTTPSAPKATSSEGVAHDVMLEYIQALPKIRIEASRRAQARIDTGVTSEMLEGNYDLVEVMLAMLVRLADFFPPKHFGGKDARLYFEGMVEARFEWHHALCEPAGPGTGGSMQGPMVARRVVSDLAGTIASVVSALTMYLDTGEFDHRRWDYDWRD